MLIWFYVLAIIILAGAVVNELRLERRRRGTLANVPDPKTEELRARADRAGAQGARARRRRADDEPETEQHERRADRAGYLREKLEERGRGGGRRGQGGVMEGHEERRRRLEYELADMEKQSDELADEIEAAKDDWDAARSATAASPAPAPARSARTTARPARARPRSRTRPAEGQAERRDADAVRVGRSRADPRGARVVALEQRHGGVGLRGGHDGAEAAAHVEDLPHLGVGDLAELLHEAEHRRHRQRARRSRSRRRRAAAAGSAARRR